MKVYIGSLVVAKKELWRMALAIDPSCGPALLAVAELELAALPSASDSAIAVASLPSPLSAAKQALSLMEFSPQAWCAYGKALEAAGQANRAAEAYVASMEMASIYSPLRSLDSVL